MEKEPTTTKEVPSILATAGQASFSSNQVILFDGVCNLCNQAVQFIIRHDRQGKFKFAPLQSPQAVTLITSLNIVPDTRPNLLIPNGKTILLIKSGRLYDRSAAAVRIAWGLDGPWKLLAIGWIIPKFIRDALYNYIAKRRYRWFGKRNHCMVPTDSLKARFLSSADDDHTKAVPDHDTHPD